MWHAEITLRVRIGRKPAKQPESSERSPTPPDLIDVSGSQVEISDQPVALLGRPIGFHSEPQAASRSHTSTPTQQQRP